MDIWPLYDTLVELNPSKTQDEREGLYACGKETLQISHVSAFLWAHGAAIRRNLLFSSF